MDETVSQHHTCTLCFVFLKFREILSNQVWLQPLVIYTYRQKIGAYLYLFTGGFSDLSSSGFYRPCTKYGKIVQVIETFQVKTNKIAKLQDIQRTWLSHPVPIKCILCYPYSDLKNCAKYYLAQKDTGYQKEKKASENGDLHLILTSPLNILCNSQSCNRLVIEDTVWHP